MPTRTRRSHPPHTLREEAHSAGDARGAHLVSLLLDIIQSVASVATATGVLIAGWQLRLAKVQAVTAFEDQLAQQYRGIAQRLPIAVLLGEELTDEAYHAALPHFYHYFDLSNEQAYLHGQRRIRERTWLEWQEGIEQNLNRCAFARAWTEVSQRAPDSFNDLRDALARRALAGHSKLSFAASSGFPVGSGDNPLVRQTTS